MITNFYEGRNGSNTLIKEVTCNTPRQKEDMELLLNMVDELIASALATSKGEQGYINFIHARQAFTRTLLDIAKDYIRIDRS